MKADIKRCTKCGEERPLSDFYKDKNKKSGYRSWCKDCTLKRSRAYNVEYRKRPEVKKKTREYQKSEARQKYMKEYMERPDVKKKMREYRREYMLAYKEQPGMKEHLDEYRRRYCKQYESKKRNELDNSYIKALISTQSKGHLGFQDIPPELIELKRQSIKLKRTINKIKEDEQD